MSTNKFGLRDGRTFIINPELEENPGKARQEKKVFLLTVNEQDFQSDKSWTVEAIRALATGLVQVTEGRKRIAKKDLVQKLMTYVAEEKALVLASSVSLLENLEDCGYNSESFMLMLVNLTGTALVDEVERSILLKGLAPTTVLKTLMPDVVKSINAHYKGSDRLQVIHDLRGRFSAENKRINENSHKLVVQQSNDRRPVKFHLLRQYIYGLLENAIKGDYKALETLSWKQLSICLAFATGRRMAEVHGAETEFKVVDGQLVFKGQLKTKGRGELEAYTIPSLVAPELVVQMHQRLKELGKASFSPEEVNRKVSKALSTELTPDLKAALEEAGVTKYKDLRDIYAVCLLEDKPVQVTDTAYIAKYLGHAADDLSTAQTYQKLYFVSESA